MPRHGDPSKRPDRFKEYIFLNNNGIDNHPNSEFVFQAKQPALLQSEEPAPIARWIKPLNRDCSRVCDEPY